MRILGFGFVASALVGAISAAHPPIHAQDTPRFYVGHNDCLVIEENQKAAAGMRLMALTERRAARPVAVARVQPASRSARDLPRRGSALCDPLFGDFHAEEPDVETVNISAFGRVSGLPEWDSPDHADFFAYFAVVPSKAIVLGGVPVALGRAGRLPLLDIVSPFLPAGWPRDRILVHAYRYAGRSGHQAVELYVGLPVRNRPGASPPIARVSIQRHFLIDDVPAGFDTYERVSGQEERVDTEAPQLTFENWSRSETEATVAFVSWDNAASWERLSTNVGWEGVHWIVQALRPGTPVIFHRFLYTDH